MIITKENQRLYLRPLDFNMCRIFTALAEVVKNHGGRVKPSRYTALISDREQDNGETIPAPFTTYITFELDGMIYYFQVDQNPFFPFYFNKTPAKAGKYSRDAGLEEFNKEWLFDCFWQSNCAQADIIEAANMIFNGLCNAPASQIIRSYNRVRVPNTFDGGWHWEQKAEPERFAVIDW